MAHGREARRESRRERRGRPENLEREPSAGKPLEETSSVAV